ncbi:hypothetical protein POJ06DRAFT_34734 [Lipomyces tetrasporus]|uniref:Postreplication repair E3 ubiquitin-protein ligase RAD18 n=1 Tax=Lipomyces tetrasporus TaxID=54092 RepID=A0AAD7QM83_9ASCO|nr:uncharacterized protein POJ06DRAFT_34734 [Lipomyces tetrasporus]KAJ8097575.1 hypothetical protein POJ06DRAFT_34734 [Lipomyces tetrasporus]
MDEILDPSDWTGTRLPTLSLLDSSLRCRICKDFFTSPFMTECAHTFCSLCIRKCIASTPTSETACCPVCRAPVLEIRLRRNQVVEDLVEWFENARAAIMSVAKEDPVVVEVPVASTTPERASSSERIGRKRRRDNMDKETSSSMTPESGNSETRRPTRAASRNVSYEVKLDIGDESEEEAATSDHCNNQDVLSSVTAEQGSSFVILDNDDGNPEGLVPCPVCNVVMTPQEVQIHLDDCFKEQAAKEARANQSLISKSNAPLRTLQSQSLHTITKKPLQRLPKLQYDLFNDTKLRSKLAELGLPTNGTRTQLQQRHTEWVSLWNANVDSNNPKTKKQLLRNLNDWESNLAKYAVQKVSADDLAAWGKTHSNNFGDLIFQARKNLQNKSHPEQQQGIYSTSKSNMQNQQLPENPGPEKVRTIDGIYQKSSSAAEEKMEYVRDVLTEEL